MTAPSSKPHVVIVGGGITGLSAAWQIQQSSSHPIQISLLEASDRWGGKVLTEEMVVDGVTVEAEAGAESFLTRKPEVWDLAHELGLEDEVKAAQNEASGTYLLHQGQMVSVPLSPWAFIRSPLMSPSGKLRLLIEPLIPRKKDDRDESLADFSRRRLGRQAADNLVTPILAGIYNADPERQSILTTSPIMRQMERDHGSLFLAGLVRGFQARKDRGDEKPRPRFITFEDGSRQLIETLVASIDGRLELNSAVEAIHREKDGYRVVSTSGEHLMAEAVLLATPSNKASYMLAGMDQALAASLRQIRHTDIGTLLMALPADLGRPRPDISGLMVPRREARLIDAIKWLGKRQIGSGPTQVEIVKLYFGGAAPHLMDHTPAGATELLVAELSELLNAEVNPLTTAMHRWPNGYPQADIGHLGRVDHLESQLPPGLFLAGSSYRGLAVPDCIRQANRTAQEIIRHLSSATSRKEPT